MDGKTSWEMIVIKWNLKTGKITINLNLPVKYSFFCFIFILFFFGAFQIIMFKNVLPWLLWWWWWWMVAGGWWMSEIEFHINIFVILIFDHIFYQTLHSTHKYIYSYTYSCSVCFNFVPIAMLFALLCFFKYL